jgi:vacuole membrane protein 1
MSSLPYWLFNPHRVFKYFFLSLIDSICSIRVEQVLVVVASIFFVYFTSFLPWPDHIRLWVSENAVFAAYWIVLGILSSVGVGSGFHTFILYLAPHILRVAGTAISLGSVNFSARIIGYFSIPRSYNVEDFAQAIEPNYAPDAWKLVMENEASKGQEEVSTLDIYLKVAWPCFLWGLGTAIGELPPYFVARVSSAAGKSLEEITMVLELKKQKKLEEEEKEEEEEEKDKKRESDSTLKSRKKGKRDEDKSMYKRKQTGKVAQAHDAAHSRLNCMQRMQVIVYDLILRYGFVAVLVAASIPNPLFDLAGITCGHFQVPLLTFFSATMIGKSLIKVTLQALFLILAAKKGETFLKSLVGDDADAGIEKLLQQGLPTAPSSSDSSSSLLIPFLKAAWRGFLGGMVVFFLMSIVSSIANEYYIRKVVAAAANVKDSRNSVDLDKAKNSNLNKSKQSSTKIMPSRRSSIVV